MDRRIRWVERGVAQSTRGETVGRKTEDKRNKVNSIRPWLGEGRLVAGCFLALSLLENHEMADLDRPAFVASELSIRTSTLRFPLFSFFSGLRKDEKRSLTSATFDPLTNSKRTDFWISQNHPSSSHRERMVSILYEFKTQRLVSRINWIGVKETSEIYLLL